VSPKREHRFIRAAVTDAPDKPVVRDPRTMQRRLLKGNAIVVCDACEETLFTDVAPQQFAGLPVECPGCHRVVDVQPAR
jgi:hypothetical protein